MPTVPRLQIEALMFVDDGLLDRVGFNVGEDAIRSLTLRARDYADRPAFDNNEWKSGVDHIKEIAERRQGQFQRWREEAGRAKARTPMLKG